MARERGSDGDEAGASGGLLAPDARAEGYEPFVGRRGVVRLRNCPFHALVDEHRELTCAMNHALLDGVVEAVGESDVIARADPRDGYCCVTLVPR